MKKCTQVLRFICDNLDADVDSPRCIEIHRHLAECPDCSAYLASMKETVKLYRSYTTGPVPPAVQKLLLKSLKKERSKSGKNLSHSHG